MVSTELCSRGRHITPTVPASIKYVNGNGEFKFGEPCDGLGFEGLGRKGPGRVP